MPRSRSSCCATLFWCCFSLSRCCFSCCESRRCINAGWRCAQPSPGCPSCCHRKRTLCPLTGTGPCPETFLAVQTGRWPRHQMGRRAVLLSSRQCPGWPPPEPASRVDGAALTATTACHSVPSARRVGALEPGQGSCRAFRLSHPPALAAACAPSHSSGPQPLSRRGLSVQLLSPSTSAWAPPVHLRGVISRPW